MLPVDIKPGLGCALNEDLMKSYSRPENIQAPSWTPPVLKDSQYPYMPVHFQYWSGSWEPSHDGYRTLVCETGDESWYLKRFDLLGDWMGKVTLTLTIRECKWYKEDPLKKYLLNNGLKCEKEFCRDDEFRCRTTTHEELKLLYWIIFSNNTVSECSWMDLMHSVVEKGSCIPSPEGRRPLPLISDEERGQIAEKIIARHAIKECMLF